MDDFGKEPEFERRLEKLKAKLLPEGIMKDYVNGIHFKIEARKRFLTVAVPIMVVAFSVSAVFICLAVWGHPDHGNKALQTSAVLPPVPLGVPQEQKPAVSREKTSVSLAEITREIKLLQALGEDPTEAMVGAMDAEQLTRELIYVDELEVHSYRQIASP